MYQLTSARAKSSNSGILASTRSPFQVDEALSGAGGYYLDATIIVGIFHNLELLYSSREVKYRARNKAGVEHPTFMHNKYADGSRIFPDSELPEDFYSTKTYTDKMLEWLQEDDDRPFYAMMTYTAPHWPIQAPQAFSDHYRGVYDEGPDVLRRKRMEALVKKGLIPQSAMDKAHPMLPMYKTRDWDALTPDLQRRHSRIMEVYAGMVECLDYHVGR